MSNTSGNKTPNYSLPIVITIAVSFLAVLGLIAALILTGHDPSGFFAEIITLIGVLPTLGAIGFAVTQTSKKTDTIVSNTNGNLTKMQQQVAAIAAQATPAQVHAANSVLAPENAIPVPPTPAPVIASPVSEPVSAPVTNDHAPIVGAAPTPDQINDAIATFTPVTPMNVTSGSGQ